MSFMVRESLVQVTSFLSLLRALSVQVALSLSPLLSLLVECVVVGMVVRSLCGVSVQLLSASLSSGRGVGLKIWWFG